MNKARVQILWDSSYLWGILAYRAISALGLPCSFVLAKEIAQGSLLCKPPDILLVPGGSATRKAHALGEEGLRQIRQWVEGGGVYLGFCGGAGLALSKLDSTRGLSLCPWRRKAYARSVNHLVSGSVLARTQDGIIQLPVWWPGQFEEGNGVEVLARYAGPGPDVWLGDRPLAGAPSQNLSDWLATRKLDFAPGQPLVIRGQRGRGTYLLSYAHLETPEYPQANIWLTRLLTELGGKEVQPQIIQAWEVGKNCAELGGEYGKWLADSLRASLKLVALGEDLGVFFPRAKWLFGWRQGAPGMQINHLLASLDFLPSIGPTARWKEAWATHGDELAELFPAFMDCAEEFLLSFSSHVNSGVESEKLDAQKATIFGHPMAGGGRLGRILGILSAIAHLNQPRILQ